MLTRLILRLTWGAEAKSLLVLVLVLVFVG